MQCNVLKCLSLEKCLNGANERIHHHSFLSTYVCARMCLHENGENIVNSINLASFKHTLLLTLVTMLFNRSAEPVPPAGLIFRTHHLPWLHLLLYILPASAIPRPQQASCLCFVLPPTVRNCSPFHISSLLSYIRSIRFEYQNSSAFRKG